MGYKHRALDIAPIARSLAAPNYLLKIIPHVDGSPRICELVRYCCENVTVKGAWTGPVALELFQHALAPVARLPVREVLSGVHIRKRPDAGTRQRRPRLPRAALMPARRGNDQHERSIQ